MERSGIEESTHRRSVRISIAAMVFDIAKIPPLGCASVGMTRLVVVGNLFAKLELEATFRFFKNMKKVLDILAMLSYDGRVVALRRPKKEFEKI